MTLAGIEPATFRFVAQHLNRCATAVPEIKLGERHFMTNDFVNFSVPAFHHLFVKVQSYTKQHFTASTSDSTHTAAAFQGHFLLSKFKLYFSILISKLGFISLFFFLKEETSETDRQNFLRRLFLESKRRKSITTTIQEVSCKKT